MQVRQSPLLTAENAQTYWRPQKPALCSMMTGKGSYRSLPTFLSKSAAPRALWIPLPGCTSCIRFPQWPFRTFSNRSSLYSWVCSRLPQMFMLGFLTHWPLTGLSQGKAWSLISFPGALHSHLSRDLEEIFFPQAEFFKTTLYLLQMQEGPTVSTDAGTPIPSQSGSYAWQSRRLCCWTLPRVQRHQK